MDRALKKEASFQACCFQQVADCWMMPGSAIKYSFFFRKRTTRVRDSFEIKGLGYIEWLEARLPAYMQGSSGGNGRLVSE